MAGVGTRTQRSLTYIYGALYNNVVKRAPFYPLNSIMTVGIAYANNGLANEFINDNLDDFSDMIWTYFGAGSNLQELYISHDRMKPEFWAVLAKAARWSNKNAKVLVDTHWIGGNPFNIEVYGFAAWTPGKGIITLRNPSAQDQTFKMNLQKALELPPGFSGTFTLNPVYGNDPGSLYMDSHTDFDILFEAFETRIYEVTKNE